MTKPIVLIDGIVFENTFQVGVWRLFYEVMKRTAQEVDYRLLVSGALVQPVPDGVQVIRSSHRRKCRRYDVAGRLSKRLAHRSIRKNYAKAIWHSTFFSPDPRSAVFSVVSIYDMIAEKFFLQSPHLEPQIELKNLALEKASMVLSISRTTAEELRLFRQVVDDRIEVATLGSEHLRFLENSNCSGSTLRKNCLFVGSRFSYKNFPMLVEAVSRPEWPKGVNVCVAGKPFSENERRLLHYFGVSDRFEHAGFLSDYDLKSAYATSLSFVFPSMGEGFGLPTLEAQINGCLPVVSDLPVFREVAGEAAIYFNPRCSCSLAEAIAKSVDPMYRQALLPECHKNAAKFSWDETAAVTLSCYRQVWKTL